MRAVNRFVHALLSMPTRPSLKPGPITRDSQVQREKEKADRERAHRDSDSLMSSPKSDKQPASPNASNASAKVEEKKA